MLGADRDLLDAVERAAQFDRRRERLLIALGGAAHDANEARPVDLGGAFQLPRASIAQARKVRQHQDVADLIQPAAAGAPKHLQKLIRLHVPLEASRQITRPGDENRAHGEIDAGSQPHRRDDDIELSGFRERLDQAGADRVAKSAMMIGDAAAQEFREPFAREGFLFGGKRQRIAQRQSRGDGLRHLFAGVAARREDQHRRQVRAQRFSNRARPEAFALDELRFRQGAQIDFLERNRPFVVRDEDRVATDASKPFHHVLRIFHAAAEKQELRFARRERERQFVVHAANRVGNHLVFVDHEKLRAVPAQEAGTLRFEGRDQDPGVEIQRQIAGRNANVPAARAPFRQLVVRQGPCRHGKNRLPFQRWVEQFENEGLA